MDISGEWCIVAVSEPKYKKLCMLYVDNVTLTLCVEHKHKKISKLGPFDVSVCTICPEIFQKVHRLVYDKHRHLSKIKDVKPITVPDMRGERSVSSQSAVMEECTTHGDSAKAATVKNGTVPQGAAEVS